jgi:hypothetical protein
MMDRTIMETQECIELGFGNKLLEIMKITDYEFRFEEINEENEQIKLQNLSLKADIITKFQAVGIELDLDPDGEIILPEVLQSPSMESLEEAEPREQVDIYQP